MAEAIQLLGVRNYTDLSLRSLSEASANDATMDQTLANKHKCFDANNTLYPIISCVS